ncbi:SH3-like domain-containing protein [Streptomyces sp. NPDC087294]|uniref:SH3-like domain-containing protein n=1 Tax=Streptomyces sp. NPDC087294 TaxID=3365777 RepID=UPI0038224A86
MTPTNPAAPDPANPATPTAPAAPAPAIPTAPAAPAAPGPAIPATPATPTNPAAPDPPSGEPAPPTALATSTAPGASPAPAPAYQVGDPVRVLAGDPPHHTRAPRYVRGHVGVVRGVQGACAVPDDEARRGRPVRVLVVYSVGFRARELWGGQARGARDEVVCDLWECYLEPAYAERQLAPSEETFRER